MGLSVTTTVAVATQPLAVVAVRVYVVTMGAPVVLMPVTVGFKTLVLLRPVAGDQLYVVPATAVPTPSVRLSPEQNATAGPGAATAAWFTVTTTVAVAVQPWAVVAVSV